MCHQEASTDKVVGCRQKLYHETFKLFVANAYTQSIGEVDLSYRTRFRKSLKLLLSAFMMVSHLHQLNALAKLPLKCFSDL